MCLCGSYQNVNGAGEIALECRPDSVNIAAARNHAGEMEDDFWPDCRNKLPCILLAGNIDRPCGGDPVEMRGPVPPNGMNFCLLSGQSPTQ